MSRVYHTGAVPTEARLVVRRPIVPLFGDPADAGLYATIIHLFVMEGC